MAYSDFTLKDLKLKFGIDNKLSDLFKDVLSIPLSEDLKKDLALTKILPIRSEKAKSELIVMPILIDLMKRNEHFFTIYSGDSLIADRSSGLAGECAFILAKNMGN